MNRKNVLGIISAGYLLAACATAGSTMPEASVINSVASGDNGKGILIVGAEDNLGCGRTNVIVYNTETDDYAIASIFGSGLEGQADPAMVVVPEGTYRILSATCERYGYLPTSLPTLSDWFYTVRVDSGEAVYMGTLSTETINVQTRQKTGQVIANLLLMSDFDGRNDHQYVVYTMKDEGDFVRSYLAAHNQVLAADMAVRKPYQILSSEAMRNAYLEAYSRDEDGSMPTKEEASLKLTAELNKAINVSLERYKADVEQITEDIKTDLEREEMIDDI